MNLKKLKVKRMLKKKAKYFLENYLLYNNSVNVSLSELFNDFYQSCDAPLSVDEYKEIFLKAFEELLNDYQPVAITLVKKNQCNVIFVNYNFDDIMKSIILKLQHYF